MFFSPAKTSPAVKSANGALDYVLYTTKDAGDVGQLPEDLEVWICPDLKISSRI